MNYILHHLSETDSTNTDCKRLAREGAPHGTVVIAAHQTGGRGRMGRTFCSPKDAGLYCSVLLRPDWSIDTLQLVTAAAAVAAAEAADALCGCDTKIKWVNDLFLGGRKFCGILTEAGFAASGGIDYVVVGIGINLRNAKAVIPRELHSVVTSIEEETGCILTPAQMAEALLASLERTFSALPDPGFLKAYRERSLLLGREITVHSGDSVSSARAVDIDDTAGLVIRLPDGMQRILRTGEVSVRLT